MGSGGNHTVEWFVLGGASITCVYHLILYIHQRDRFLLLYANYLLSLVIYLSFVRYTNFDTFTSSPNSLAYVFDDPLIYYMLFSYVYFISKVLDIHNKAPVIKFAVYAFYVTVLVLMPVHAYKVVYNVQFCTARTYFLITKSILATLAFIGLFGALHARKTIFVRTIIAGGFIYAGFSVLAILSIYYQTKIFGLLQYELYFVGCLLDIAIFSSALGYRNYLIQKEKVYAQALLVEESEKNKALLESKNLLLQNEKSLQDAMLNLNRDLQNDVGASLSSIHIFADLGAKVIDTNPEKSQAYLVRIAAQSQKLMSDIGDIIWLANLNKENANEALLTRIKNYAFELLTPHGVALELQVHPNFYQSSLVNDYIKQTIFSVKEWMDSVAIADPKCTYVLVFAEDNSICFLEND